MRKILLVNYKVDESDNLHNILSDLYDVKTINYEDLKSYLLNIHQSISLIIFNINDIDNDLNINLDNHSKLVLRKTPILFVINEHNKDIIESLALDINCVGFIRKPFQDKLCLKYIDNILNVYKTASIGNLHVRDPLTGLHTSDEFLKNCNHILKMKRTDEISLKFSIIDVENFKLVNEFFGYSVGDKIIIELAKKIQNISNEVKGLCSRSYNDIFYIFYESIHTKYVHDELKKLIHSSYIVYPLRIRVGEYLINDNLLEIQTIRDWTSITCKSINSSNVFEIKEFETSLRNDLIYNEGIVSQMNESLHTNDLKVWFQPIIDTKNNTINCAEALVRWEKNGTLLKPNDFLPVFEDRGLIYELDKYIWEQSCIFIKDRLDNNLPIVPISINITRFELMQLDIIDTLKNLLNKYNINIKYLEIEITEKLFTKTSFDLSNIILELKNIGFNVKMDDFGSELSSFASLKIIDFDTLKIDTHFLNDLSTKSTIILKSIINMCKELKIDVIAEGVETVAQKELLEKLGCYKHQGFLYSAPIPVDMFSTILDNHYKFIT